MRKSKLLKAIGYIAIPILALIIILSVFYEIGKEDLTNIKEDSEYFTSKSFLNNFMGVLASQTQNLIYHNDRYQSITDGEIKLFYNNGNSTYYDYYTNIKDYYYVISYDNLVLTNIELTTETDTLEKLINFLNNQDAKKANIVLQKIVQIMEDRYDTFSDSGTKNIKGYNKYIDKQNENRPDDDKLKHMEYIVVIIDELADLMLVAAKEVEDSIMRITQMARAAGIHLIIATQRPSTDVITGVVKANIPSRISFAVSSQIDSRTILDAGGAEKLLGKGDMFFLPIGINSPIRIQGSFITDDEIKRIIDHTVEQQKAQYDDSFMNLEVETQQDEGDVDITPNESDNLYDDIVDFVVRTQKASASLLQRKFKIGYNKAATMIDQLEENGIIGPATGNSKPREVLVQFSPDEASDE